MDMIKEFISKASADQIKEISKTCMDRQTEVANFRPNVGELVASYEGSIETTPFDSLIEGSEVVYKCPKGWDEFENEGETVWENEKTGEICKPCENVEEAPKGKWGKNDEIIW